LSTKKLLPKPFSSSIEDFEQTFQHDEQSHWTLLKDAKDHHFNQGVFRKKLLCKVNQCNQQHSTLLDLYMNIIEYLEKDYYNGCGFQ
jgi:hypothetical protein